MHPSFRYRAEVFYQNGLHEVFYFTLFSVSRDVKKRNSRALLKAQELVPSNEWKSIEVTPA